MTKEEPRAGRPDIVDYGIKPEDQGVLLPWAGVQAAMEAARNYWVSTTRPDGRPHATPVWGIWLEGVFMFAAGRSSRKSRNLAANPAVAVHLESGDDVVILEGVVEELEDSDLAGRYADAYEAKYQFRPDPADPDSVTYVLRPGKAFAWREKDYPDSATRWLFD
jgi:PPOX class probable F420-dependent enzyme